MLTSNDQNPSKSIIMQTLMPALFIGAMLMGYLSWGLYDRYNKIAGNVGNNYYDAHVSWHDRRSNI